MFCRSTLVLLIGFTHLLRDSDSLRIAKHKVYDSLESGSFCFRRLNATHSIGCQTEASGNVGVLHIIQSDEDLNWVINRGTSDPYVAAFYIDFFTTKNLIKANSSGRVSGVLLLHSNNASNPKAGFSPDSSCPNDNFGLYTENKFPEYAHCGNGAWNNPDNPASDMMFMGWQFPIFLIEDQNTIDELQKSYEKFNKPYNGEERPWPLCAVEMNARMSAAKDTPTCMSRNRLFSQYCDPISSYNIFAPLEPFAKSEILKERSIVVLATRLDSFSLFFNHELGANSVLTSLVVLLSVAKTLAAIQSMPENRENRLGKNVLFTFFNGESWNYIGSSRAAFDLRHDGLKPLHFTPNYELPLLSLRTISHIIELHQLTPSPKSDSLVYHTNSDSSADPFENLVREASGKEGVVLETSERKPRTLPPSSLQSFLKYDSNITGVVLSGFNKAYENKYYNSFLDDGRGENLDALAVRLQKIATVVSQAIHALTSSNMDSAIKAEPEPIKEMLDCFLKNSSCSLFRKIGNTASDGEPYKTYTSVGGYTRITNAEPRYLLTRYVHMVGKLLSHYTGSVTNASSKSECTQQNPRENKNYAYDWLPYSSNATSTSGSCVRSTGFFTEALSPAFLATPDYRSTEYSTWTESVWTGSRARIFVKPSRKQEIFTLLIGILITTCAFAVVFTFDSKVCVLLDNFPKSPGSPVENSSNHVPRGVQQYNVRGDEITFAGLNRNDVVTTQL